MRAEDFLLRADIVLQSVLDVGDLPPPLARRYQSKWWTWPLMLRPMCYSFVSVQAGDSKTVRDIIFLGNPLIMWGGLAACLWCLLRFLRHRRRADFLVLFFYAMFSACWAAVPPRTMFYYYYYPAALALSLVWVVALDRSPALRCAVLALAGGLFLYFLPVISMASIPYDAWMSRMWFRSWI
jgi:dolichyl-phosphate-mannose-protein mannosyltransferase